MSKHLLLDLSPKTFYEVQVSRARPVQLDFELEEDGLQIWMKWLLIQIFPDRKKPHFQAEGN